MAASPARFAEITPLLAALPPLAPVSSPTPAGRVDVALYAGPHGGVAADWPALRAHWHDGTAPAARLLAGQPNLDLHLFDLSGAPIGDSTAGPALTETQAAAAMAYGMMAAKDELALLILSTAGDAATGANASALAVMAALLKCAPASLSDDAAAVTRADAALATNRAWLLSDMADPLTILATLGGHESCAIAGAILAARLGNIPVWLEGGPALAAALTLAMTAARLAGGTAAARDLLGHAQATSIPAALQPALETILTRVSPAAQAANGGDAAQSAALLAARRAAAAP